MPKMVVAIAVLVTDVYQVAGQRSRRAARAIGRRPVEMSGWLDRKSYWSWSQIRKTHSPRARTVAVAGTPEQRGDLAEDGAGLADDRDRDICPAHLNACH